MGAVDVTAATEHAKKKQREEGILDFYHFQKHEARWKGVICQEFPRCLHPYFGSLSWLPVQFVSLFIIPIAGSHIRHKHLIEANHSTHRDECLQCKNKPPCFSAQIRHIYNLVILSEKFI